MLCREIGLKFCCCAGAILMGEWVARLLSMKYFPRVSVWISYSEFVDNERPSNGDTKFSICSALNWRLSVA